MDRWICWLVGGFHFFLLVFFLGFSGHLEESGSAVLRFCEVKPHFATGCGIYLGHYLMGITNPREKPLHSLGVASPPAGWHTTNYHHRSIFQSNKNYSACGHYRSEEAGNEVKKN